MRALRVVCVMLALWESSLSNRNCPDLIVDSCHCSAERSKELSRQHVRVKVVCNDVDLMDTLQPSFLPNRTVSLNLSKNKISLLRNGSFYGLAALEKLDLRNNLISTVEPGAFRGLLALRRLDLSNNRIGCLSPEMFLDLGNLSKLNLSSNIFSTLTVGLFTHLVALKVLHFSTETLFCDCQLKWLLLWARSNSVRISNDTVCVFPTHLHGLEFRNLREHQLSCAGPLEMPLFQLIPSQRQLVFRGDRLPLQCTATFLDRSVELRWRHNGHIVTTQEEQGVYVEETLLHDCCLLTSEVILSNIDVGVAGTWECLVTSSRGNTTQQMEIVVVETSAPYCPADRVTNNKGDFRWPKTLAGILAFQPCAPATFGSAPHPSGSAPHPPGQREKKAWRRCDRAGRWAEDDYTQCPYASELTRLLHELTQITINTTNAQPLGQQLVAFTSRAAHFSDVMDVIFVTHLVERLTRLVEKRRDLGDYISDIASNMMLVEEHILWMAQNEARACTRIVQCVERIADLALTGDNQVISKVSANIALEAFLIRPSNFLGLSCTALQHPSSSAASPRPDSRFHSDKDTGRDRDAEEESLLNFKCHTVNSSGSPASQLSKMDPVVVKVIIDHRSEKLTLSTGMPDTVEQLHKTVKDTFGLHEEFTLHYLDEDFGDFFTLHTTDQVKHKGTIKVVIIPSVVLSFSVPETENLASDDNFFDASGASSQFSPISSSSSVNVLSDDTSSLSSQDTIILSPKRASWPKEIVIPSFSVATEAVLRNGNEEFLKDGTVLNNNHVRSEIMERLADYMYSHTAYPTGLQVGQVAEALVKRHPCLTEPGSRNGWIGWMYSLKYKMGNYRSKLRNLGFPEVTCNSLKNKRPGERKPAQNVKKARRGEVIYLPHYPSGESNEQQEQLRLQILSEMKKKDSMMIKELMSKTFVHRRHDVVSLQLSITEIKERWPALFDESQVNAEFQRITTVNLEPKFMSMLDRYSPKLLSIFQAKKGATGERHRAEMNTLLQSGTRIQTTREVVIRCLIDHLGEDVRALIKEFENSVAVASIHLPLAGTPLSSSALQSVDNSTCRLQFIVFRNGKLFPCTGNSSNLADDGKRRSVSTPVAFTKLDGCSLGSDVHSVTIALRHFALGVDPTAAYWDFDLLDGHGGWRAEGCHITGSGGNTTTIHCTHHNNFAVLMDLKKVLSLPPYPGEFLHPVVYACTAVMLLCLFASIITYIVHHSAIRISRKGWHMLLNFCFHTALTFAVFAGGINRIKYPIICQAVGVVLHYSSLSTMLWLGVTARNIYKQVTKKPPQIQDGDPPPPPRQPLLKFYLVSGGVPLIICGVTAAVNINNYGTGGQEQPYCWMAWEPSLGAFFGPVALIFLVTCVYFLCTFIQLRKHPEKKYELKQLTEEQQRLAAVDVPTHCHQGSEPGALAAPSTGGHCPAGCPGVPINPALLANEHSFKAQLRTAAFTLFLFLATWTFGALSVSQGLFLDMIFSCLYGAFSVTLGLFVLIHHCAKRDDVWHCWCSCCPGRQENACSGAHGPAQARPKVNVNGDTPGHGHGHSHCHHDSPCPGKALISCTHGSLGHCKHATLPSSQNHVTCLAPVTPCCAALHSQQLMEEEPAATHVLLHPDPEGYRPGIQLHPCLKSSTRTKGRNIGRRAAAATCGAGSEREYAYHIPSSGDGGSVHSSHTDSPHSTHERHAHICPHLAHEGHHDGHHTCHAAAATTHEALACHHPCHRHICCAKADLFPSLCPAEAGDTGVFLCGCGKVAEPDPMATHCHLEMHAPRRQSYPQNPPNQNGILKGGLHEGLLYASDSTGNIRTGPWKNETTV